jgi:hypothetical protein
MQRTYKTAKGTELPLLNLRGKEYLEVKYRLVWFREEHPEWAIETELLSVTDNNAYARASIKDETGRVIATSHKFEARQGFPDFIEKAETGAIGRSLALVGYGTQFCADELSEAQDLRVSGERLNSPVLQARHTVEKLTERPERSPGEYEISFGRKYKGKKLNEVDTEEFEKYLSWLENNATQQGLPMSLEVLGLRRAFDQYCAETNPLAEVAV